MNKVIINNPSNYYRSLPFWGWNDRLEKEVLIEQIHEFKKQGFGGFIIHSREGLETPYLGEEWDDLVALCVKEAQKIGLEAWLYDEDRWPSGSCGGVVTRIDNGAHALKGLTLSVVDTQLYDPNEYSNIRAAYAANIEGDLIHSLRRLDVTRLSELTPQESLLIIQFESSKGSVWFNGSPPPDNLSYDTVQAFIDSTYEHYRLLLDAHIPSVVPGIFTDEPSLADRHANFGKSKSWLPWSEEMDEFYRSLGYGDVFETLPYVYFDSDQSFLIRHNFWHSISLRYENVYSKTIGEWCTQHNLIFTGHYLQEDKLGLSTRVNGSVMPHYTHQHMPGIDLLGNRMEEYLTVKQVSSVAHQYSKQRVLCETYAGGGWNLPFERQKIIGEWQYLLGVTNRCQHHILYSLRGKRKRDYPPSFNTHSQWGGKLNFVEDYFARLSFFLQRGRVVRTTLLIHPMSSVWGLIGCSPYGNPIRREERDVPKGDEIGFRFNTLLKTLESRSLHADLGDETLIQRDGWVCGTEFGIKDAGYSIVVIPQLESLFESTRLLLEQFYNNGGTIVVLGKTPKRVNGILANEKTRLLSQERVVRVKDTEDLVRVLGEIAPPLFRIVDQPPSVHSRIQEDQGVYYFFILNIDQNQGVSSKIQTSIRGNVKKVNLNDGSSESIPVNVVEKGLYSWDISLEASGSELYSIDTTEAPEECKPMVKENNNPICSFVLSKPTQVYLNQMNALVLDRCSYSLEGEAFSDELSIWQIQGEIRSRLNMINVDSDEVEQHYRWVSQPHINDGKQLVLSYTFNATIALDEEIFLVLESPSLFSIKVNNTSIPTIERGEYLDSSFKKVSLPRVKKGKNILELKCNYKQSMSLESVFLVGNFGVNRDRMIINQITSLGIGSWTEQGLFHYPGNVSYHYLVSVFEKHSKAVIKGPHFKGVFMSYMVNGSEYVVPWGELGNIDITQSLRKGSNNIEITIYGGLANLLGPLHLKKQPSIIGPGSFTPTKVEMTSEYQVEPLGLLAPLEIKLYR